MKKKLLILYFLTLMCLNVSAKENIIYYHMLTKTTPGLSLTNILNTTLEEKGNFGIDFKLGLECSAKDAWNKESRLSIAEIASGRYWTSLQENDNLCDVDTKNMKWFAKTTMYYNICVAENSPIKTVDDFKKARLVSVGVNNVTESVIKYLNKNHGTNIKVIKFPNSTQAALSVISGDTEAGIIADTTGDALVKNGKMRCIAFGDKKNSQSIAKLFPELPEVLKEPSLVTFFGIKNVDDSQFKKIIAASLVAKENMDKKIPGNSFESIKKVEEQANLEKEFYNQTTGLFLLTDKLR